MTHDKHTTSSRHVHQIAATRSVKQNLINRKHKWTTPSGQVLASPTEVLQQTIKKDNQDRCHMTSFEASLRNATA